MSGPSVWMPLYVRDYLADTAHLTLEQSGAYLHLLMHSWVVGPLPNDDEKLARVCRLTVAKWLRSVKADVMTFFDVSSEGWTQKRLEKERRGAKKQSEQKSTAAKAMWLKKHNTTDAAASEPHQSRICPLPSPSERKKEPPNPPTKTSASKRSQAEPAPVVPDWMPQPAWDDFTASRKAMRKPMTTRAAELQIQKLDEWRQRGLDIAGALNAATMSRWQSVVEPKPSLFGSAPSTDKPGFYNGKPITAWNRPPPAPIRNGF